MFKRAFVAVLILVGLMVARRYFGPTSVPHARGVPDMGSAPPRREVASAIPTREKNAKLVSRKRQIRSRGDVAPAELLERRSNLFVARETPGYVEGAPLARFKSLGLKLGEPVKIGRQGYRPLAARAVFPQRYSSALGPIVLEEGDVRVVADQAEGWAELKTSADGQPLMVNPSGGHLVLVTGTIEVAIRDVESAEALAERESLLLLNYDATIGVAFLKAPHGYALLPALDRILAQPGVSSAELEIIQSRKTAR